MELGLEALSPGVRGFGVHGVEFEVFCVGTRVRGFGVRVRVRDFGIRSGAKIRRLETGLIVWVLRFKVFLNPGHLRAKPQP